MRGEGVFVFVFGAGLFALGFLYGLLLAGSPHRKAEPAVSAPARVDSGRMIPCGVGREFECWKAESDLKGD